MAISTVILDIDEFAEIVFGDQILLTYNNGANDFVLTETFVFVRSSPNQVSTSQDSLIESTNQVSTSQELLNLQNAINLATAINLDASLNSYDLSALAFESSVTITSNTYTCISVAGNMTTNSKITSSIENQSIIPLNKKINLLGYNTGFPNNCENINGVLGITGGSNTYNIYIDNVLTLTNQQTPVNIALKRGVSNKITVNDSLDNFIGSIVLNAPRKLLVSEINNTVENLDTGANISISVPFISQYVSPYTYSLDNVTYVTSNVFTSIPNGNYTVYVKDALGCVTSRSLVIDGEATVQETIFEISEINPIRFAKYETGKKNYFNTLSNDSLRLKSYCFNHKYLETDKPKTQFKTNAKYINVYALKEDLTTTNISVLKKTDNLGKISKSTGTYYSRGDGKSAIYFGSVNLLDPITNVNIGDFNFGSSLPIWANTSGSYVTIEDIGQVKIDTVVYDDFYKSWVLQFNINYVGNPIQRNISAKYNIQNYDIYEFTSNISTLPDLFNLVIEVGKSENEIDFTYVSEKIETVNDRVFLLNIDYWDSKNLGGFVYQTGIKNKLRLEGYFDYVGEQITEGYNGDKKYYSTKNEVYNTETLTFYKIPFQIAHKLRLVMAHENLYINGIGYVLSDIPEIDGEKSYNLKKFSVNLKPNGNYLTENFNETILDNNSELEYNIEQLKNKKLLLWSNNN